MMLRKVSDIVVPLMMDELTTSWVRGTLEIQKASVETVHMHKGVSGVSCNAFDELPHLRNISVDPESKMYESENGILYLKNKLMIKRYPPAKEDTEYVMPDDVMYIERNAFMGCKNLKKVVLNENIEEIPKAAFAGCDNLREIYIPSSVTKIGPYAFNRCSNLEIFCPRNAEAVIMYAAREDIYVNEGRAKKARPKEKTDGSVRGKAYSSARDGLEIFKDDMRTMPPFVKIKGEPPILIGQFENGVYYKANSIAKPFICTAYEAYQIIQQAAKQKVPMQYRKDAVRGLYEDCKAEIAGNHPKKPVKTEDSHEKE